MMPLSNLARVLRRFLLVWVVDAVSLLVAAALLPGMDFVAVAGGPAWLVAAAAALLLGLVNFVIRSILLLVARPFGLVTTLIVGFFVDALALLLTAALLPGFEVDGPLPAIAGGLVLAAVNTVLAGLLTLDDADSFYEQRILHLAQQSPFAAASSQERGVLILEIDGVSYRHIQQAVALGYMPTLRRMIEEEGYVLSRIDCGLPSQTSASQAGILFGNNHDIPAFTWYDKQKHKLYVSHSDAVELNQRHSNGQGLVRDGSSISNMFDGDAEKAQMTLSRLRGSSPEEARRRAEDVSLLLLNPYFLARTLSLFLAEAALDVWQGFSQRWRGVWPRLNRLKGGYPFKRAATTVLLREAAHHLVALDLMRGSPAIYTTFAGYDKVAHHSGPWTRDAFSVLKRYDREVAQLRGIVRRKAPRPYEVILLSDHGQSSGATFYQRYGVDLKGFIQQHMPQGSSVAQSWSGDDGLANVGAIGIELENAEALGLGGRTAHAVAHELAELAEEDDAWQAQEEAADDRTADAWVADDADVIVCATGNLAHIYFDFVPRKVTLNELDAAYPGVVEALVQHEGIGFVVGYDDEGAPVVIGKQGRRHLVSGEVSDDDPLLPYTTGSLPPDNRRSRGAGPAGQNSVEVRAWQLRRMAEFPSAGDLIVNSTLYPDGTVAAFEELIGAHGGLGGEQTDAFILHPPDMAVPETRTSEDFFHLLNARRGLPAA